MTYTKQIAGKHYMEYTGPWLAIFLFLRFERKTRWLKMKLKYKGVS
jgi:hypothetical protein